MQGAQNGPRMDADHVGPHQWVAGGLVKYKHGMRDGMRGRHQEKSVASSTTAPREQEPAGRGWGR